MGYLGRNGPGEKGATPWENENPDPLDGLGEGYGAATGERLPWLLRALVAERGRWSLWLPVALGLGVALYFSLSTEPPAWMAPVALAALAILAGRVTGDGARAGIRGAMALCAGLTLAQAWSQTVAAPTLSRDLGPVTLVGRVRSVEPLDRGWRVVFDDLEVESLSPDRTPDRVRLRLHASETEGAAPRPGDRLSLRGKLRPPPEPVAPGAFDFARRLWFERIGAVGYAVTPVTLVRGETPGVGERLGLGIEGIRVAVSARLIAAEPDRHGPLAAALLTGDRRAVPEEIQEDLRAAGLAHLLAISGLHMSMVGGLLFLLARGGLALWPRVALTFPIKKIAAALALLGCLGYLGLSGANVPAQRAFIMTGLVFLAILVDRTALSMRTVALAATLVLVLAPWTLLGPSFQMSFAAVIALVAAYEALWPRLGGWRAERGGGIAVAALAYLAGVAFTTLVASAATMPFAAFHFHRIAPYGLVANLLAVPLMGFWVMPWMLATLALVPLGLEHWGLWMAGWGLDGILAVAHWVAGWEGSLHEVPAGPAWALGLVALGGLWACLWRGRWRLAGLPVLALGVAVPWMVNQPDLLVSREGRLMAVRSLEGGLMVSDPRQEQFTREVWEEAHGGRAGVFPARGSSADGRLRCDAQGCLYELNGRLVALPRTDAGAMEDASLADVMVATTTLLPPFDGEVMINLRALWRNGAHALWIAPDGEIRVETVRSYRGERPWSAQ